MSVRSTFWLGLVVSLAGCEVSLPDAASIAVEIPERQQVNAQLFSDSEEEPQVVVAGSERPLKVRLLDLDNRPLASKAVMFGLVGSAQGASLDKAQVDTDASGYAQTVLKAGGTVSSFQVRASADGAQPVYFDISVVEAARPGLKLGASYKGQRAIVSRRISVIDNMSCEKVQGNGSDLFKSSYVQRDPNQLVIYQEPLGAGRSYAAVAWGADDTNSTLAKGCLEFTLPVTDSAAAAQVEIIVPLVDLPLELMKQYDVTLDLDVSQPLAGLAMRTQALVASQLPATKTPEASFLLDLLKAKLDFADARAKYDMDVGLQEALASAKTGPLTYFTAVSAAVAEEGAGITVDAMLTSPQGTTPSTFEVSSIVSIRGGKSAREVDEKLAPVRGAPELMASYDSDRGTLDIKSLTVPLGFGGYVINLLEAVRNVPDARGQTLASVDGCAQFERFVSERSMQFAGFPAQDAKSLCSAGVQALLTKVSADWSSLDQERAAFQLKGPVYVHDRDGDGRVDDLGPSELSGSWKANAAASETTLKATLRVTPKASLTI